MKKRISAILFAFVLLLLVGCQGGNHLAQAKPAVHTPEGTELTLKILTEDYQSNYGTRMGKVLEAVVEKFKTEYPNVTLEIEYLPHTEKEAEERELRIEQLRYEILAGEGPDIYLLSSSEIGMNEGTEPVFTDVNIAMRNGAFHELSAYYNADEALHTEELKPELMEAGMFGKARYILPLAYNVNVVHVSDALAREYGMSGEELAKNSNSFQHAVYEAMLRTGQSRMINFLGMDELLGFYPFGQILDYDQGKVLVTAQELADRLRVTQNIRKAHTELGDREDQIDFASNRTVASLYFDFTEMTKSFQEWFESGNPAFVESAEEAFLYALIRKAEGGSEYVSYPVRSEDGTLSAKVTWWGAVGAGCDHADVAYDFLREFLTREVQWGLERDDPGINLSMNLDGLPVRTQGLLEPMLALYKRGLERFGDVPEGDPDGILPKWNRVMETELTAEDFPILTEKVDTVLFDSTYEQEYREIAQNWFDPFTRTYKELDFDQIAADYIRDLEFFLAES